MIMMCSPSYLFLLMATTLSSTMSTTSAFTPQLKQVHVLTRHGARTTLPKHPNTLLDKVGATLTPLGQKQLYDLGVWLRDQYNGPASQSNPTLDDGYYRDTMEFYDASYHRLESSGLDRTLTAANALSLGLFPLNAQAGEHGEEVFASLLPEMPSIPVYMHQDSHDINIRAYKNCPTFRDRLAKLYGSDPWTTLEANHAGLLQRLTDTFPDQINKGNTKIRLRDVWNVYDPVHVVRTECRPNNSTYACLSIENWEFLDSSLDDTEFQELEQLMTNAERLKYGVGTAGNLLGSNLLWRMLIREEGGNFFLYSAHAATILGFLSTLKEVTPEEQFVEYGSAVIVEFHQEATTKDYYIRMSYKRSGASEARHFNLDHVGCGTIETDGDDPNDIGHHLAKSFCPLSKFLLWTSTNTILKKADWCTACNNTFSDVCMKQLLKDSGTITTDDEGNSVVSATTDDEVVVYEEEVKSGAVARSFFGGLFAGFIIMGVVWVIYGRRNNGSIGSGIKSIGNGITGGGSDIEKRADLPQTSLSEEDLAMVELS
jgi:hypothetical protein